MTKFNQRNFNFPSPITSRLRPGEIVVDLFAGGGGASEALRQALGRDPDIAINHDEWAVAMHAANHPLTKHMCEDVFHADPVVEARGRSVGWMHGSPDCTHFSQAQGGQPRSRAIRALAWVLIKWAGKLKRRGLAPRIVSMENVSMMLKWCPLVAKRDKASGRVIKLDGNGKVCGIAAPGERVPLRNQFLIPDERHLGKTWRQFVAAWRALGYELEWQILDASDYGADTDRKRLFMVARCDGEAICWPNPTHGRNAPMARGCAANSIDWSVLGTSIFTRPRPLRPNTIRRLLSGARRGDWPLPYIDAFVALLDGATPRLDVTADEAAEIAERLGHSPGIIMATGSGGVARNVVQSVPTITAGGNGAAPHFLRPIIVYKQNSAGGRGGRPVDEPLPVISTNGAGRLVTPVMMPLIMGPRGSAAARNAAGPLPTITTGGAANKKRPGCARAQLVEPIVAPYYGSGSGMSGQPCSRLLPTATGKARFGLVEPIVVSTCNSSSPGVRMSSDPLRVITTARGGDQALAEPVLVGFRIDALYRMLFERELFNAQGFPPNYIIDRTADGRKITRTNAIRMVGNSVSPPPLAAIARANLDPIESTERLAA